MMKRNYKKILSLLLICLLSFSIFSTKALGATNDATVEVLGGGGGGGVLSNSAGGGGGGGEYRRCTETLSVQSYTVTVGAGGTADNTGETDSSFSGTGISMTADGGNGTIDATAGTAGTGGVSTDCDTAVANFDGGTPGAGLGTEDDGGGGGGGAGYGGKGGNGAAATATQGGAGGGGGGESGAGGNASGVTGGTAGTGGGGVGGNSSAADVNGSPGTAGTPATYHIVGGGGGGGSGGPTTRAGGACGAPGAGSGGGETTGAGNGCRGEIRIIYVDSEVAATGGTETIDGSFRIHTFTSSGTFQVTSVTAVPPTVTTDAASGVGTITATLNGNITATGGENATDRGFAWGTSSTLSGGDTATTTTSGDFGTGAFTQGLFNILSNRTYYFRAYATNSAGAGYGTILNFTTSISATPSSKIRIFKGAVLRFLNGRMILYKQ